MDHCYFSQKNNTIIISFHAQGPLSLPTQRPISFATRGALSFPTQRPLSVFIQGPLSFAIKGPLSVPMHGQFLFLYRDHYDAQPRNHLYFILSLRRFLFLERVLAPLPAWSQTALKLKNKRCVSEIRIRHFKIPAEIELFPCPPAWFHTSSATRTETRKSLALHFGGRSRTYPSLFGGKYAWKQSFTRWAKCSILVSALRASKIAIMDSQ